MHIKKKGFFMIPTPIVPDWVILLTLLPETIIPKGTLGIMVSAIADNMI